MRLKTFLGSAAVLVVSGVLTLLVCELGARLALNAADYLSVEMVRDDVMGAVTPPAAASGRFDAWGYRNAAVPPTADIVAIGDSHTYGNAATMEDSWPYVLARLSGQRVYDLAMGGYGPNQYFHLFTTKALTLKPKTIVVGLYMGDDFENAFLITYGLEHWRYLRALSDAKVDVDTWDLSETPSWHKRLRIWLSEHSVLYQLVFHGPALGRLLGEWQIRNAGRLSDSATTLNVPERRIVEAFRPKIVQRNLDMQNEFIREGMRITFKLLAEMNDVCRRDNIRFVVAVIPTKETVFAEFLEHNAQLPLSAVIDKLIAGEREARATMFEFFAASGIEYVDLLPALRRSVDRQLYARSAADMHPNRNGYQVIGETIWEALRTHNASARASPP